MIPLTIKVRNQGPIGRGLKRAHNAAAKQAWSESGEHFVREFSDKRFTHAHARQANYAPRKRRYEFRKLKLYGHTRPLEFTGRTRLRSRTFRVSATSKGATVRYPLLRVCNFKHPNSEVNMRAEWERLLPNEAERIAEKYETVYEREMRQARG